MFGESFCRERDIWGRYVVVILLCEKFVAFCENWQCHENITLGSLTFPIEKYHDFCFVGFVFLNTFTKNKQNKKKGILKGRERVQQKSLLLFFVAPFQSKKKKDRKGGQRAFEHLFFFPKNVFLSFFFWSFQFLHSLQFQINLSVFYFAEKNPLLTFPSLKLTFKRRPKVLPYRYKFSFFLHKTPLFLFKSKTH